MSKGKVKRSKAEVARIIENFLEGKGNDYDWDDFISIPILDNELERIRRDCAHLDQKYPATVKGQFCNGEGMDVLRSYVKILK